MFNWNRCAKINVKVLVILILIMVALGASLFAARQVRRDILSKQALDAGEAAFENEDWPEASKQLQEYLGRNPDDVEILKKYAKARLSIRPLEGPNIGQAIAAYRRVLQLEPLDEDTYDKLAKLYGSIGNFEELAYIARTRLTFEPNDLKAPLWLSQALVRLNKVQEARQTLEKFISEIEVLPEKHSEYVQACIQMSSITSQESSVEAKTNALELLNKAVEYMPDSVEALANRARFYRVTPDISNLSNEDRLALARKDLEAADALDTEDPGILFFLGTEWMAHGELGKAEAKLQAVDNLTQEAMEKYFLDLNDWKVARFLLASELSRRRGDVIEGASLADEALKVLTEERHRVQVIPSAIPLYIATGKVTEARKYLDEYLEALQAQQGAAESRLRRAYLQALVAKAEEKYYDVIDILQPIVVNETSAPELWGLLAEAYIRTNQSRRSVSALRGYLRTRPGDPGMTLQLANEYSRLRDWKNAFETAQIAESLNPTEIAASLLRIEASVNLSVGQGQRINTAKLEELSSELAQLREKHPERVDIRILQAIIAVYLEKPDKAESQLMQAIEECNEPLKAEMQLVRCYIQTKRMTEAVSVCQAACQRHSGVAEPWLSLSGLYAANADYDSARDCLRKGLDAVADKQEKRSLSTRLALLELMQGDRATGIDILKKLAEEDEQEIRARSLLLGIREIQEEQATAEELVSELKQAEGESGLWWRLHQASLWLSSDEWRSKQQDITDLLQYCINADPQWSAPVFLLVGMYEKLEDFRRVEDTCRQALTRNPSATDIADRLLILLERQGRFSEAEQILQQIQADARVTSALQVRTALSAGDFTRAIDELKLRISDDDQDANSRIQLARLVYQQSRDTNQAFAYLKEAEAITPRSRTLTVVKSSILRAEGRTEESLRVLDDYVADINDFNAYIMRAVYLAKEGEFERAEADYKKLTTFAQNAAIGYQFLTNFYITNNDLDKAVATIEEGSNAYPADLGLKRNLMEVLFMRGHDQDRQKALDILTALEEQLPQDPELMKYRAIQMLKESTPQSLKTARDKLENVVKLNPTSVDAHLMLFNIAMQQGEYQSARDYAIRAIGSNSDNLALVLARGRAELELENTRMAAELADLIIQKDPNNTEAINLLVAAGLKSKNHSLLEEARMLIESKININPSDENLLIQRVHVLVSLEQSQLAIPELKAYYQTKEGSNSIPVIVTLADLYRLTGDVDQAKEMIERAEQLEPNNQNVIHVRFLWLVSQNRFEELEGISSAYISAKQQNPTIMEAAASILAASDSVKLKEEGLKLFEYAANLSPESIDMRLNLASTLYQTGNVERAEDIYREVLEQHPNNIQVLNDLAWILQEHDNRYTDALELADRGLNITPDDLHLLDTRGTILSNLEDRLADAKKDFERLIELSPSDTRQKAKALLKLGRLCVRLNDPVQAKKHLEIASEIDRKIDVFTPDERTEIMEIIQKSGVQPADK